MPKQVGDHMKTTPREIVIFHNPDINKHKKTVAHAKSIVDYVQSYSFEEAPTANNVWTTIYEGLDTDPMDIFDTKNPKYEKLIEGRELNFEGWLKIVKNNSDLIRSPIAVREKDAVLCDRQTEIYKLMDESPSELEKRYSASTKLPDDEERLP